MSEGSRRNPFSLYRLALRKRNCTDGEAIRDSSSHRESSNASGVESDGRLELAAAKPRRGPHTISLQGWRYHSDRGRVPITRVESWIPPAAWAAVPSMVAADPHRRRRVDVVEAVAL